MNASPNTRFRGTILLLFDFEIRKNLLYVDWNEKTDNWNTTLVKNDDIEQDDLIEDIEKEIARGEDIKLDFELEKQIERIEEEVEFELEDQEFKVEDVDYKKVRKLPFPKNLLYTVKFFRKYIRSQQHEKSS